MEAMARLHLCLRDIIDFFVASNVMKHSIEKLEAQLDNHQYAEFLELANGFGKCMAFIDHDSLTLKLATSWSTIEEMLVLERKQVARKLRNLEGDKNADPDIIQKLQNLKAETEQKKANALVQSLKFKLMSGTPLEKFKNPNFDAMANLTQAVIFAKKKEK
eukprot:CAMPEP_0182429022 /NCGR_PEP_ID=MMETSP1167-20130531/25457_1 /TAXON_ID=2988 /ORGANISM="Mallomonas Sp, Strain CCMP3275" /LENGTH=160 /DNA_ID=CAMNT_0024612317 /DNA_START=137 /DNA_END=619 /DNA_ORIENTATION=+